ncbi:MAG: MerR family transcriptional regulator [Candidatus Cybelea sp.]
MKIGELATSVGVAPSAIRFYERIGVLPPPPRMNGARQYGEAEVDRLQIVMFYRSCGVSLDDLAALMRGDPGKRWERAHAAVERRLDELEEIMRQAKTIKRRLRALLDCQCRGDKRRCVVYRREASSRGRPSRTRARASLS